MPEKKKIQFIINPFAGKKSKDQIPSIIERLLNHDHFEYDLKYTKYGGHAEEIAQKAVSDNVDAVIAVGGDGTINEISTALVHTGIPLGIIPGGSGNGLSMHLGIGRNKSRAIGIINQFNTKIIDTALVNGKLYVNMAGVGIDGLVAYKTKLNASRGFTTYFKGAIMESIRYKNQAYKVEIDGKAFEGKFLSVNVANGSMFGYHFTVAPEADTSDGLVDTLMIHDAHKMDYFGNAWRFFTKRIHKSKLASTNKSTSLKITAYENTYMHIDGEGYPCEAGELEFEVRPHSLRVIC